MNSKNKTTFGRRFGIALLAGTALGGPVQPLFAQAAAPVQPEARPADLAQTVGAIRTVAVVGNERLEADTVRAYMNLRAGQAYSASTLDQAVKDLYATELFAEASITDNGGNLVVQVKENPVINRVVLEGNKSLKEEKIKPEIRVAPRQIYTRSKVRSDVARILELYKRQGRYAATVEPKIIQLPQNRVDLIFEIAEGPKSKVRAINIIGNEKFSSGKLRSEMVTKEAGLRHILSGNTSYDPDRMAYDQQKLRQFYLTEGYPDFRVVSASAELTSDKQDFVITYVVEEGERYKFGDVKLESELRDFRPELFSKTLGIKKGDWYNAKRVEDTVDNLNQSAGAFGYAFAQVSPDFRPNRETRTMDVTFKVADSPRVYVERIDVNGNTTTQDKVVRREFRLNEGDAFNTFQLKRSENRIKSLGYFQEDFKIEQKPGSAPDRIVLESNVQEKSTGEFNIQAGFSSVENFILAGAVRLRNFRGMGQVLDTSVNWSSYSKSASLGFTEPYLFDRPVSLSANVYRRDINSFNYINGGNDRKTTFNQLQTGMSVKLGLAITEYVSAQARYTLNFDNVSLDKSTYYFNGVCDPLQAGRYLCDQVGKRTSSILGYSLMYDARDNAYRPTRGQSFQWHQDFAGLGGSVRYLNTRAQADKFFNLGGGFIFSLAAEGGYIRAFEKSKAADVDPVRINDRFFLGEPTMRGFDIRGIGPRVLRYRYDTATKKLDTKTRLQDDALGGTAYYMGRAELQIPFGASKSLGLRPSIFADIGAVWNVRDPSAGLTKLKFFTDDVVNKYGNGVGDGQVKAVCRNPQTGDQKFAATTKNPAGGEVIGCPTTSYAIYSPFEETFLGNTAKPRLAVGIGVNWNSPMGPLRIDFSKALLKEPGDQTKSFQFNVGTQF